MTTLDHIEAWLRSIMAAERRDSSRGIFIGISFGLLVTVFAVLVVQGIGMLLGMVLVAFGLAGLLGGPLIFLYMVGAFAVYTAIRPRRRYELVALGPEEHAPRAKLLLNSTGFAQFGDPLDNGPRISFWRLFLSIPLAPPAMFWAVIDEFRMLAKTRTMDYRGCAEVLELLMNREGRLRFEELAADLPGTRLARVLPDVVRLQQVHTLTTPPGMTLTDSGREAIANFISARGGEPPLPLRVEPTFVVATTPRPRANEVLDLPPEIANSSGRLPPPPAALQGEGVLSEPVRKRRVQEAAPMVTAFALEENCDDTPVERLEPGQSPQLAPSDAPPLELA